jgi:hypothetical protein
MHVLFCTLGSYTENRGNESSNASVMSFLQRNDLVGCAIAQW